MSQEIELIRDKCLSQKTSIVANSRASLTVLTDQLEQRLAQAAPEQLARISVTTCRDIIAGVRAAPGRTLYHERIHLLECLEALDVLAPPPAVEALPDAVAPDEPAELPIAE